MGFSCFPRYMKRPKIEAGAKASTNDPNIIKNDLWRLRQNAAPAIDLGKCRLLVIDLDCKPGQPNGVEYFMELAKAHGLIGEDGRPLCPVVYTPSGGQHWYFRQPKGGMLGNRRASQGSWHRCARRRRLHDCSWCDRKTRRPGFEAISL